MDDFSAIKKYAARYIELSEAEEEYFLSLLRVLKVRKKQHIVQPEFVCKYRSYILKGAMRAYLVGDKGQDHTIAFAIEDWWISDYNSYIYQEPATLFVEALEETVLIQISYDAEQTLMTNVPKFERFFRILTQRSFAFLQKRLISNLSKSAEERYEEFLQKYPSIVQRVPQYTLASYLGFSTEFLSKIRNKRTQKS
jgi:CRP-like cAMP-binding protein